jgi:hypothetical protein
MDIISISSRQTWIPLSACKDGYVYYIHARNAKVGIFNKSDNGFIISRHKFDKNFLFTEFHWDTGEPYGTAKPLRDLNLPIISDMSSEDMLAFLNGLSERITEDPWYDS